MSGTVRILSGGAAQGLVEQVRPLFEGDTGHRLDGTFGAVGAMRDRLLAGEPCDLVILTRALVDGLVKDGHVLGGSARDIGTVETAVAVRTGDLAPPLPDAASLRAALLAADAIHFPDPELATAGIHVAKVLRELGISDRVAGRLRTSPNGATAMRALATSKSARPIGCTQATEILSTPGITLVGSLPTGSELATVYTAGVTAQAAAPDLARALIAEMTNEAGRAARRKLGFL
jgi:molybdate transport system substrate-binding protein